MPERPLPPPEERLSLKEAGERFDPPRSKKAVEQLLQRGSLDFARELDEEGGRARRVVTTLEWMQEYVEASGGRARLREERKLVPAGSLFDRLPAARAPEDDPAQRVIRELNEENLRLKLRVAELEAQLERRQK